MLSSSSYTVLRAVDPLGDSGLLVVTRDGTLRVLPTLVSSYVFSDSSLLILRTKCFFKLLPPWPELLLLAAKHVHFCLTKVTKTKENPTFEAGLGYHSEFEASLGYMAKYCLKNKIRLNMYQKREVGVQVAELSNDRG